MGDPGERFEHGSGLHGSKCRSDPCLGSRLEEQRMFGKSEAAVRQVDAEMIAIYDQTILSNLVCAIITMALGFWNEWRALQFGQPHPDAWHQAEELILQTLRHYSHCGNLDALSNDVVKLCRIQLQRDVHVEVPHATHL